MEERLPGRIPTRNEGNCYDGYSVTIAAFLTSCTRGLQKQILPLLDGLDEVETEDRPVCITAINRYYREHLMPLVVCSRTPAYRVAAVRERLYLHAVMVQPLTPQQVNEGLERAGKQFSSLKEVFNERVALQNLVRVPLMLRFLIGIDPQIIVQELLQGGTDLEVQLRKLYIETLLKH